MPSFYRAPPSSRSPYSGPVLPGLFRSEHEGVVVAQWRPAARSSAAHVLRLHTRYALGWLVSPAETLARALTHRGGSQPRGDTDLRRVTRGAGRKDGSKRTAFGLSLGPLACRVRRPFSSATFGGVRRLPDPHPAPDERGPFHAARPPCATTGSRMNPVGRLYASQGPNGGGKKMG